MGKSLCVLVDRPPYGSIQPAEAIRHAMGAMGKGWEVVLVLTGDGVYTAIQNQSPPEGEWIPLSESISDFIEEGKGALLVESAALEARGITAGHLVQGAKPAAMGKIAEALARCDRTLVF